MVAFAPKGLTEVEQAILDENLRQLTVKRRRASLRDRYYDGKKRLDSYGISIPPSMQDLENVLGWPAKTCDSLSARLHLDGLILPGESKVDPDLAEILALNKMSVEWPQAQISTFINGAAFGAVLKGDPDLGEPENLILMMPATEATGLWNVRTRALSSAVWVHWDKTQPARAVLFLPKYLIEMRRDGSEWVVERFANPLPRLNVTPLRYQPRMGRPFGMSRITRPVMSLTDQAVRAMLRSEVSAEFYSSPQRALLGADDEMFRDEDGNLIPAWEAIIGKLLVVPRDEDGNLPTVEQFPQMTQQPHSEHLRTIATMFAGETAMPISSLGIIHDNPASADAMDAAWADFVGVAEQAQDHLGIAAVELGQNALMLANNDTELPKPLVQMRAKWRSAKTHTRAAMADAVAKQIGAGVLRPDSTVALEQLGYDRTDISRIQAEHAAARESDPLAGVQALLNPDVARNSPVPA